MSNITQDVLESMRVARQRILLDGLASEVGTPLAYLKAAWADPVLYGGRGERRGIDVDVLVAPRKFRAFARRLEVKGFRRQRHDRHPVSAFAGKDWTFEPAPGFLPVDLHRALAMPPWFALEGEEILSRAVPYDSLDGPIVSLCPEDQVVFFAAHSTTHVFDLDDRHLEDTVRIVNRWPIDWGAATERARRAHLLAAITLCARSLHARGADVPSWVRHPGGLLGLRVEVLSRLISVGEHRDPARRSGLRDVLLLMPLISDRSAALPRFLLRHGGYRAVDAAVLWLERATSRRA